MLLEHRQNNGLASSNIMNKFLLIIHMVIFINIGSCGKSDIEIIERDYGINFPVEFKIEEYWDNYSSARGRLPLQAWSDWKISSFGYKNWNRMEDWQLFIMRRFVFEQQPGDEKYYTNVSKSSRRKFLFYDARNEMLWIAIE